MFGTFRKLWHKEFSHLRIRGRGEDTCTDCFKIKNNLRHLLRKRMIAENKVLKTKEINTVSLTENITDGDPKETPDEAALRMITELKEFFEGDCPETEKETAGRNLNEDVSAEDLEDLIVQINIQVEGAQLHVKMHIAQREKAKKETKEAEKDLNNKVALKDSTFTITIDMIQNSSLPSLSGDQCGDFYYMSPYAQFIFGI